MSLLVPEIILQDAVRKFIAYLRVDYANNAGDTTQSLLYQFTNGLNIDNNYDFWTQAQSSIITNPQDNPRHLKVFLAHSPLDTQYPSIHINTPAEMSGDVDGLGFGQNDIDDNPNDLGAAAWQKTYNRSFKARYNIVILSDNRNEAVMLYHLVKAGIISMNEHMDASGLKNLKISGSDVMFNTKIPDGIFTKTITLDFYYDINVPDMHNLATVNEINLSLILRNELS